MKIKIFLLLLLAGNLQTLWAQPLSLRERVYLQTDKDIYLAGELVWLKMLTTAEDGLPLNFSKVGYVELLDTAASRAQAKLLLKDGKGSGSLILPTNLPNGTYRLVGYTRYMQNESPDVFFEKIIGVVNPLSAEVSRGADSPAEIFPSGPKDIPLSPQDITASVSRSTYSPRSLVELQVDNLPENLHSLSVSAVGRDMSNRLPAPAIGRWKSRLSSLPVDPVENRYLAEYEGHIITGQVLANEDESAAPDPWLTAVLAFPANEIQVFSGKINPGGTVAFFTSGADGYTEVVTTLRGSDASRYRIEIDAPFVRNHRVKSLPLLDISQLDNERVRQQSIAMQVQYSYANDSLTRFSYTAPHFWWPPDKSYIMEEYTKFGTMEEVFLEFVTFTRFRRINGKYHLIVAQEEIGFSNTNTLVLLDDVPVWDHGLLVDYNPLLLDRIDVYYRNYVVGGHRYNGIIAMYTKENNYPELAPDPSTRIFSYESPQAQRLFFSPDHSARVPANRLPDYRTTLYWDPDIDTQGQSRITIPFYTSDIPGEYRVVLEGVTREGKMVYAAANFEVE